MGQTRLFLFIFILFSYGIDKYSTNLAINDKSIDDVLGTRTRGSRMVGSDESMELLRQCLIQRLFLHRKWQNNFFLPLAFFGAIKNRPIFYRFYLYLFSSFEWVNLIELVVYTVWRSFSMGHFFMKSLAI